MTRNLTSTQRQQRTNLMQASNQWCNRPASERFWSIQDLFSHLSKQADSVEAPRPWDDLSVVDEDGDLFLQSPKGRLRFTNWSFGQLCSATKAPRDFVAQGCADNRPLAAQVMQQAIANRAKQQAEHAAEKQTDSAEERKNAKILVRDDGGAAGWTARAVYSTAYGRVPDLQVVRHLMEHAPGYVTPVALAADQDDPRNRPATADDLSAVGSGGGYAVKEGDIIGPSGVYHDDRSMFAFMVNPNKKIDDGNGGSLWHGFFVTNSEVGNQSFSVTDFLFEGVCGNHIVWGCTDVRTRKRKHTSGIVTEWKSILEAAIDMHQESDLEHLAARLQKSREVILGNDRDEVVKRLSERKSLEVSAKVVGAAFDAAEQYQDTFNAPVTSGFGIAHGLTRYSQSLPFSDKRTALDRSAGKILDFAISLAT